jgi:hypothetical protein
MTTSQKIARKLRNMITGLALVAVLTISAWLFGIFNGKYVHHWIDERGQAQRQSDAKAVFNAAVKQDHAVDESEREMERRENLHAWLNPDTPDRKFVKERHPEAEIRLEYDDSNNIETVEMWAGGWTFKGDSLKVHALKFRAHTPEAAWFAAANWIRLHEEHDPKAIGAPSASPTSRIDVQP